MNAFIQYKQHISAYKQSTFVRLLQIQISETTGSANPSSRKSMDLESGEEEESKEIEMRMQSGSSNAANR
jgi:hypothetical protein